MLPVFRGVALHEDVTTGGNATLTAATPMLPRNLLRDKRRRAIASS
jgi:hypothetical protein